MTDADLIRRVAIESLRAATQSLEGPAADDLAQAIGRRVGEALAGETTALDASRVLALEAAPTPLPSGVADGFVRGLAEVLPEARQAAPASAEPAPPARPAPPWGPAGKTPDLVAATRRAMHDLNQPLTVILGYAAILKRAGAEPVRLEAAEHIVKEARKMNEIIAGLSRLARGLDAA